jgi:hypothetical protein
MPVDFVIANKTKSVPVETLRLWESDHEKCHLFDWWK